MKKATLSLFIFFLIINDITSQSLANYNISLTTLWNVTDHTSVPGTAHWSPLVGATHNTDNEFLELEAVSPLTDGIKNVAETGDHSNFNTEVNTAIAANKADKYINAGGLPNALGTFSISNLEVNENFPLITLVSMIAPSPDWFIAINSLNLRSGDVNVNNGWRDTFTMDVFTYDAGTDDGTDYTSDNAISTPRVGVFTINGTPINGNKMGTITFTYNSSTLSNTTFNTLETVKIHPNPTSGKLTISNPKNLSLKSIEVYNVLGSLIKNVSLKEQSPLIKIDLSHLNTGIYLLRLKSIDGKNSTRKLIIN